MKGPIEISALAACFETTYDADFSFPGEVHNFWEFTYVAEGKINVTVEEKVLEISAGQIIFYKPMTFHKLWAVKNMSSHIISAAFYATGKGMEFLADSVYYIDSQQLELLQKMMEHAGAVFDGYYLKEKIEDEFAPQLIRNYIEQLLISIVKNLEVINVKKENPTAVTYRKIIDYLQEHLYDTLTIEQIAKACDLTVFNLKKIFKQYSGEGVIRYFNRLQIAEAKKLLEKGLSVGEVSKTLSFSTQNYFAYAFRRETNLTPMEYKKKIAEMKKNNGAGNFVPYW